MGSWSPAARAGRGRRRGFGSLRPAGRVPGADVHDIVQVHRRHMIELMQRYWHLKAEAAEDDIGLALIADAELFRLEGIVRWLDAADTRLKLQPVPDPASPTAAPAPAA